MANETQGPGVAGLLLPVMVEAALRQVEKRLPSEGASLRRYVQRLASGEVPGAAPRIFPSVRAHLAKAAARGASLSVGCNAAQQCARGCGRGVLVLLVDGLPVAFFSECEAHAAEATPSRPLLPSTH